MDSDTIKATRLSVGPNVNGQKTALVSLSFLAVSGESRMKC